MNSIHGSDLVTRRTPRIIGRESEMERLERCLHARGEKHVLYYFGEGGIGKTRILEELIARVKEIPGKGFHVTDIIDLFHTDAHSTSDVERAIIEGLDPETRYFKKYREERDRYELLRERGTDPKILEDQRRELSRHFVSGCRELALDAHKLVLCFDTVELLQYESSEVEEIAGLQHLDTRIKPWLLENLAQLNNVLIVFAGRPKKPAPGEQSDPQQRLINDMRQAFGDAFTAIALPSLTAEESRIFLAAVSEEPEFLPEALYPVVHLLTRGRPVFLHLVVDLLRVLSEEPGQVVALLESYTNLLGLSEADPQVLSAREHFETEILKAIFNETSKYGWVLDRLALMPKGVDAEILTEALGLPLDEADELLAELKTLSFIKIYHAPPDARLLQPGRVFLHDELYHLLTSHTVIPNVRYAERQLAHALVRSYYAPHIHALELEIERLPEPIDRIPLRARLQKLQVERMTYLLVHDAAEGYEAYKRLSEEANWRRWVGYSMRLLDEFLRIYNNLDRRPTFARRGITHDMVIKDSAAMWAERFYWWGQYRNLIEYAERVLNTDTLVGAGELEIRATICARWADAKAVQEGYTPEVVARAVALLEQFPSLADCSPGQLLSRGRLTAAIGYQHQQGGSLDQAITSYEETKTAFDQLPHYAVEKAIWLHALAFVHAKRGQMLLAELLAQEALRINESLQYEYSTGLTLSALAGIERMLRNYDKAIKHGHEALTIFGKLDDPHGTALAYNAIVHAQRRKAKDLYENGRKIEEAQTILEKTCLPLAQKGIDIALRHNLASLKDLKAEFGRSNRELGHVLRRRYTRDEAQQAYRNAERVFSEILQQEKLSDVERADLCQDQAEVRFFSGDLAGAEQAIDQAIVAIGSQYVISPGEPLPSENLPVERFASLGRVELLRGQMLFEIPQPEAAQLKVALQHYVLAYAYFLRFSEEAVERDTMVQYVFGHLRDLPATERRELLEHVKTWALQQDFGVNISNFFEVLTKLIG